MHWSLVLVLLVPGSGPPGPWFWSSWSLALVLLVPGSGPPGPWLWSSWSLALVLLVPGSGIPGLWPQLVLALASSLDIFTGYLHWIPSLDIFTGYLHWIPSLDIFTGYLRWIPSLAPLTLAQLCLWIHPGSRSLTGFLCIAITGRPQNSLP